MLKLPRTCLSEGSVQIVTEIETPLLPPPTPQPVHRSHAARWVAIGIALLALVVLIAGVSAVVADWTMRNAELEQLVSSIEESEAAMTEVQADVAAAYEVRARISKSDTAALDIVDSMLSMQAADAQQRIAAAGAQVEDVHVAPWHTKIAAAKAAYLAHNQAWQTYLGKATEDPGQFVVEQPEVNDTFVAFEPKMKAAVPPNAWFDLRQRVADLFVEQSGGGSSSGGLEV